MVIRRESLTGTNNLFSGVACVKQDLAGDVKRYKRQIKANLLCSTKLSKQFLADFYDTVDIYVEESGVTRIEEIRDHFGSPEQIARSFLAETDVSVIRRRMRQKQALIYLLIAALLLWTAFVVTSTIISDSGRGGHGVTYMITGTPTDP